MGTDFLYTWHLAFTPTIQLLNGWLVVINGHIVMWLAERDKPHSHTRSEYGGGGDCLCGKRLLAHTLTQVATIPRPRGWAWFGCKQGRLNYESALTTLIFCKLFLYLLSSCTHHQKIKKDYLIMIIQTVPWYQELAVWEDQSTHLSLYWWGELVCHFMIVWSCELILVAVITVALFQTQDVLLTIVN